MENLCAALQICNVHVAWVPHTAGAFSSRCVNRRLAQGYKFAKEIPWFGRVFGNDVEEEL